MLIEICQIIKLNQCLMAERQAASQVLQEDAVCLKSVAIVLFSLLFRPARIALSCNQMYAIARFMLVEMLVTHA